ncbi:MAG: N-acetylmuramoyl-L-alanine amidase, partial [Gemmobacter sp.]|nr:N-acetylmuramoyl-L-alanine amidase [Gemmobacter sp.]
MKLLNHRIDTAKWLPAHFTGAVIVPEIVILHDTAGRLEAGNSAAYLASKNTGSASAQFVIELDGKVTQLVATNRQANHAGESTWNGRRWCNGFSIGIELVNPGRMTRVSETMAMTWWGQLLAVNLFGIREVETKAHGRGLWMPYPEAQLAALIQLLEVLFGGIKSLSDITTHWYVSPGRKTDTNPLFPLDEVRARILGRDDPADTAAELGSEPAQTPDAMVQVDTLGDSL